VTEPVVSDISEDLEPTKPIQRSDTIGKILDKYSNYSTKKEFGYRSPVAHLRCTKNSSQNGTASYDELDEIPLPKTKYQLRKESRDRAAKMDKEDQGKTPSNRASIINEENEKLTSHKSEFDASGDHMVGDERPDLIPRHEPLIERDRDLMMNPFKPNVDYFNMGRFIDPIADKYARNVSAYNLPGELNDRYGPPVHGYQNPVIGDPTTYGMQGVSDFFTPNYCSRYNRQNQHERPLTNGQESDQFVQHPEVNMNGPPPEPAPRSEGNISNAKKEKDDKSDLSDKISKFLQPKEREYKYTPIQTSYRRSRFLKPKVDDDYPVPNGVHHAGEPNHTVERNDLIEINNMRPSGYGRGISPYPEAEVRGIPPYHQTNMVNIPPYPEAEVRSPRSQRYGGPTGSRRMTAPHFASYGYEPQAGYQPEMGTPQGKYIDVDDDLPPRQNFKDTGYQKRLNVIRNALSDDPNDFDDEPDTPETRPPPQQEFARPSYLQRGGSSIPNGSYSGVSDVDEKPWRRHLNQTRRKPFVAPAYDNEDESSTYDDYNPKQTERQLATRIAKQYLSHRDEEEQ